MRLWTWQKSEFDITDKTVPIESLKYSIFLHSNGLSKQETSHFKSTYQKLFEKLGTNQFHWYFTEEFEAKSQASHLQFLNQNRTLWEIEIPDEKIFRKICDISWNYLLNRHSFPMKLYNYWKLQSKYEVALTKKWEQDFHDFWALKSENELWDLLFLDNIVDGCTQVLLSHPLDNSYIIRNPIEEGKWWNTIKANDYSQGSFSCVLPCRKCLGYDLFAH